MKAPSQYKIHPVAKMFPLMEGEDYRALVEDIKAHGLLEDILVYEDRVVDGRNRLRACLEAGEEPRFMPWNEEGSLVELVLSRNLMRRHLTSAQRAAVAMVAKEQLAKEARVRAKTGKSPDGKAGGRGRKKTAAETLRAECPQGKRALTSSERAAKLLHVSDHSVKDAVAIAKASPEKLAEVRDGKLSLAQAKRDLGLAPAPKAEEPAAPWDVGQDLVEFRTLFDRLKPRWVDWQHKTSVRDCLRVLANEAMDMTIESLAAEARARKAAAAAKESATI